MFSSTILDVAIGMVFVYLLLSLICSAAYEMVEYWLKRRASDLERGVRELLTTHDGSDPKNIVQQLYNHGMVNGLFQGKYEDSRIGSRFRHLVGTKLPSYIPSRNFALALMDLILPGQDTQASGATGATPPPPPEIRLDDLPKPAPSPTEKGNALHDLRKAIHNSDLLKGNDRLKMALTSLIDAAGNDVSKARENIEAWFNSGMDRVSGWYKRRSQIVIFGIAIFVTIGVNADSVTIARKLSSSKALRESLVAAADAYSKANATATPAPSPTSTPTPSASPDPCWANECKDSEDTPNCKLKKNQCAIQALGLPIGWNNPDDSQSIWPGFHFWDVGKFFPGWYRQIRIHALGWLLTALAVTLGAPFWFDMLNKLIVVRSTVKPKEKSPDEKSKD